MKRLSYILLPLLFILPVVSRASVIKSIEERMTLSITRGEKVVLMPLEVADTPMERELGLMYQIYQPEELGMYFTGGNIKALWMKNTWIPLDIIFLNADHRIIHSIKNALPCMTSDCPIYLAPKQTEHALEFAAGWLDKYKVQEGDLLIVE